LQLPPCLPDYKYRAPTTLPTHAPLFSAIATPQQPSRRRKPRAVNSSSPPPCGQLDCTVAGTLIPDRGDLPGLKECGRKPSRPRNQAGCGQLLAVVRASPRIRLSPWIVSLGPSPALVCRSPPLSHLWHCVGRPNWRISGPSTRFGRTPAMNHRRSGRRRRTDRGEGRVAGSPSDRVSAVAIEFGAYRFGWGSCAVRSRLVGSKSI
jgi:hypothetical protein